MKEDITSGRERTCWGRIGLVEFNERTEKWECRIDDCQEEMDTSRKISQHRKNTMENSTMDQIREK